MLSSPPFYYKKPFNEDILVPHEGSPLRFRDTICISELQSVLFEDKHRRRKADKGKSGGKNDNIIVISLINTNDHHKAIVIYNYA